MSDIFDQMVQRWAAPLVCRSEVPKFCGGLIQSKTLANLKSQKQGPPHFRFRNRVCYETRALANWMRDYSNIAKKAG